MSRRLKAVGVDVIKVAEDITDDQLKAVVEESNAVGLKVLGHTQNIKKAVAMGMKHEEHMNTMARALLERKGKNARQPNPRSGSQSETLSAAHRLHGEAGRVYQPNAPCWRWVGNTERWRDQMALAQQLVKDPNLAFVPADIKATWIQRTEAKSTTIRGYANIAAFLKQVLRGRRESHHRDRRRVWSRSSPGSALHYEMQMLTDLGIPPMRALQGATLWAAEALGQQQGFLAASNPASSPTSQSSKAIH